jgi:hypothetical protein
MPQFFSRKEEKTIGRRGNREVVRTRFMQGNWIMREEFALVEPLPGRRSKRWTHYRTQGEAERAIGLDSAGDLIRGESEKEWWRL